MNLQLKQEAKELFEEDDLDEQRKIEWGLPRCDAGHCEEAAFLENEDGEYCSTWCYFLEKD